MNKVRLISFTQPVFDVEPKTPEEILLYCAKVSNPKGQSNFTNSTLLEHCMEEGHWSVFDMADATVEIETPRDIARQLLRHQSFYFQEFSQRYSDQLTFAKRDVRRQDKKNRQNSIDDILSEDQEYYRKRMVALQQSAHNLYCDMVDDGIAKECARVVLPEGLTMSRLYMKGSVRSWYHYLQVREGNGTQKEHTDLAKMIREELIPVFPSIFERK